MDPLSGSLLDDKHYVTLINNRYETWVEEFKDIDDFRFYYVIGLSRYEVT